jgi:GNAT superfamily N-acetyltransferase
MLGGDPMTLYRNAEIKDINKVVKLEIECMEELQDRIGSEFPVFDERKNNEASLVSIIEGECGVSIIAEETEIDGSVRLVGAAIALDKDLRTIEDGEFTTLVLRNLFVDRNYRNRGIAHKLLEMIVEWATGKGYIDLETFVYTPNPEIQGILSQFGVDQVVEERKRVLDKAKYDAQKERELDNRYIRAKGNSIAGDYPRG